MIPTINYQEILSKLSSDRDYWVRNEKTLEVTMCGLLFARPQSELAAKEVFPELGYFDTRLGRRFHLFTAGCFLRWIPPGRYADTQKIESQRNWHYSDTAFDELRREIESVTSWRYGDGVELLLFNAMRNQRNGTVSLDFHSAIAINLQELRRVETSQTVASLIGRIANYCDNYENGDATWGFSDNCGSQIGLSSIWNLFVGLLPDSLRNDANKAKLFTTQDLSKRS